MKECVFRRNVGEGLAPPAGGQPWYLHAPRSGMHPIPSPRGRCPRRGRMRAGEHLWIALQLFQNVTAPRPSSVAYGDSFPQGKPRGPLQVGTAAKERCCIPAGGASPAPTLRRKRVTLLRRNGAGRARHRPQPNVWQFPNAEEKRKYALSNERTGRLLVCLGRKRAVIGDFRCR